MAQNDVTPDRATADRIIGYLEEAGHDEAAEKVAQYRDTYTDEYGEGR